MAASTRVFSWRRWITAATLAGLMILLAAILVAAQTISTPADRRPGAPSAAQTKTFQQGSDGYTGVRDTWVSRPTGTHRRSTPSTTARTRAWC